jgi:hypothetical protein
MMGQIEAVNRSKSGKTLGVKIGETWYTSKNWELENAIGKTVVFEPSTSNFNGQVMQWLNEYQFDDQATTPATQAFEQAHTGNGQVQKSDKDLSITSLALCKCCTPTTKEEVLANYHWFKTRLAEEALDVEIPF